MMLGDDGGEVGGARGAQAFRANPRVIGVDPIPAGEGGPESLQRLQGLRGDRPQKHRHAPLDHREMRRAFPQIVQQRGLLQQLSRLTLEPGHRLEHVEAMTLIVHG